MVRVRLLMPLVMLCGCAVDAPSSGDKLEVSAESTPTADLDSRAKWFVTRALNEGRGYEMLRELTQVAPARLSGTAAAQSAVEWGLRTMRTIGLENVRPEKVMVPRWVRGEVEELTVLGSGEPFTLPITALGGSCATPADGLIGDVVMVRTFEQLRALGDAARGKIVFFNRPMPRTLMSTFRAYGSAVPQRSSGAIEAAKVGAVAAVVRSMTTSLDDYPHTGATNYQDGVPEVPAVAVSTNGAEKLAAMIAADGSVRLRLRLACETRDDVESANVVGEIRGAEKPEQIVLIGGHLDSWDIGEGAHDDGAGCAHSLEAVRLILASGIRPQRTIRVVLFMNEENGLRGARAYAKTHADELALHYAAIESDRGGFEPKGFTASAQNARMAALKQLAGPLRTFGMGAMIPGGGGADISVLAPAGTILFGLVVTSHRYFDYHHSDRDRIEAVNERELAMGAAAIAYLASCLAEVDLPPN